jgi:putative ABC transport system ATP-binding protein
MRSSGVQENGAQFGRAPGSGKATQAEPAADAEFARRSSVEVRQVGRRDPNSDGWLIREVSFSVYPGDRLGIRGTTGSGKTVLLRALALLDPIDHGSINWRGGAIRPDTVPEFRSHVVYLHQRPALFDGSVEHNLRHPFTLRIHREKAYDRARVLEMLAELGRPAQFLEKFSRDLSGGEAQLVALVRAIQLDPTVLLLDEPTASLDKGASQALEALVNRWYDAGREARSFVWVSHDADQALRMTSRQLHLRAGRLETEVSRA